MSTITIMDKTTQEERELTYPLCIRSDCRFVTVLGPLSSESEPFINGKGYVLDDRVWIFSREKPKSSEFPYFWYEHGEIMFGKIRSSIKDDFSVNNLRPSDISDILSAVSKLDPSVPLYNEKALIDINSATSLYIPVVNVKDDCLKKLIKMSIIDKKIDINGLKSIMQKPYQLSNLKTALANDTKMSITNFIIWCNLLGLKFDIYVADNENDSYYPLKKVIHYCSETDSYTDE